MLLATIVCIHYVFGWLFWWRKSKEYVCISVSHFWNRERRIKINQMEIQHETTTYYRFIKYQGKLLMWVNSKNVQNTFDSWKCQLLCNKMSKVENSYQPSLKTYWNNIISTLIEHKWTNTHVRKFWFPFTWTDLHICKICVYANWNLHLVSTRWKFQEFAYGANFPYVSKSIHIERSAHVSIFAYMQIFAHVCKFLHENAT